MNEPVSTTGEPASIDASCSATAGTVALPGGCEPPAPRPARLSPLDPPQVEREQYEIKDEHARGGLGRILRGRDRRLDRPVAIKELLVDNPQAKARFVREALVSARLQHPAIVPVYEAGRWPDGEPFYAMKFISGRSLKELIAEARSLEERLGLVPHVLAVADAIAYAHEQKVIHRDLKPANVLVGRFGETVVIDWGLAKDLSLPDSEEGLWTSPYRVAAHDLTLIGSVMGTPQYMPPEQARGEPVDERADVYAIGALLYDVLAGEPPYAEGKPEEILRRLLAEAPPPLETRQPGVPKDLAAIVRKAMARRRGDRYPSAKELAADLHRFQTGQLVAAREYTRLSLAGRWLRRYRLLVASVAILALGGAFAMRRVVEERNMAEAERIKAEEERHRVEEHRNRLILEQAKGWLERDPTAAVAVLKNYPIDGAEWGAVHDLALNAWSSGVARHVLRGDPGKACYGDFSPDGRYYASSGPGSTLVLWDMRTGQVVHKAAEAWPVYGIRFAPDGATLAYMGPESHQIVLWNRETDERRVLDHGKAIVHSFTFSPDGRQLLAVTDTSAIHLWPLDGSPRRIIEGHDARNYRAAFSPDGRWIAFAATGNALGLYDALGGENRRLQGHTEMVTAVAFAPQGRLMATSSRDGTLRLWDPVSGASLRVLRGHRGPVHRLVFSPDGRHLASGSEDRTVRLWSVATGAEEDVEWLDGQVDPLAFSPDGRFLVSAGESPIIHLRNLETRESQTFPGHRAEIHQLRFSPDGRWLASSSNDKTTRLWAVLPGEGRVLRGHEDNVQDVAFSPDGAHVMTASRDGTVRLWEVRTGASRLLRGHLGLVIHGEFSPDGTRIASASWDKTVRLWEMPSGTSRVLAGHEDLVLHTAFSPDGRLLASSGADGLVWLWDVASGAGQALRGHEGRVVSLAFSPDGKRLASAGSDGAVRLWDLPEQRSRLLPGHQGLVSRVAFSPDGRQLASAGGDGTVRLWDMASGVGQVLGRHAGQVTALLFSRDGRWLISGSDDGQIWRRERSGQKARMLATLSTQVRTLDVTRDGRLLAALGTDGAVWLWSLESCMLQRVYRDDVAALDVAFSPDGQLLAAAGADRKLHLWPIGQDHGHAHSAPGLHAWLGTLTTATLLPGNLPGTP